MGSESGHKAYATRVAKFGPEEQKRAYLQARFRADTGCDPTNNPYARNNYYSAAALAKADRFVAWALANPEKSHDENPYRWT